MTLDERAQIARDALFNRYDTLNALWLNAEEQLTQFHIPRPVYYTYDKYQDPNDELGALTCKRLGLRRIRGKWRICYELYEEWHDRELGWTPITECSADIRVEAAKHLDGLREAVVKFAEDFIPKVDEAVKVLADTLRQPISIESREVLAERAKLNGHNE